MPGSGEYSRMIMKKKKREARMEKRIKRLENGWLYTIQTRTRERTCSQAETAPSKGLLGENLSRRRVVRGLISVRKLPEEEMTAFLDKGRRRVRVLEVTP